MKTREPSLFAHWQTNYANQQPDDGSRVTGDCHARFCESPRVKSPRATHLSIFVRTSDSLRRFLVPVFISLAFLLPLSLIVPTFAAAATAGAAFTLSSDAVPTVFAPEHAGSGRRISMC